MFSNNQDKSTKIKIEELELKTKSINIKVNKAHSSIKKLNAQLECAKVGAQNMDLNIAKKLDVNNMMGAMIGMTALAFGLFYFSFNLVVKPQLDEAKNLILETQKQNIETQKQNIETQKQNRKIIELLRNK